MGVQDPGGGIPLGNYYDILEFQSEPKRKMGKKNKILGFEKEIMEDEVFMVMESTTRDRDLSRVSPFLISKVIENAISGKPMLVSRLKDGKLLIKVANQKQAEKIKKIKSIPDHRGEIQVQTLEHPTLNCSKGVIRCPDIEFLTEGEILDGLQAQKATEVIILKRKINNVLTNTRTAIVTFKTGRIPRTVDFGLYPLKVELYIPRPMRCTTCMRLGHTKKSCQRDKICANCSELEHKESCVRTKCVSCGDAHNTLDRNCPVFCDEMEISKIRTVNKITYGEAKRIRRRQCPEIPKIYTSDISYAQRTKSATKSNKIRSLLKVTGLAAGVFSAYSVCRGDEKFYNNVFMPIVRLIPPETAHDLAVLGVKWKLFRPPYQDTDRLRTRLLGMAFSNPIGIAAGFDKHGEAVQGLQLIGFGFVEIGSVTPEPQPGNARPRIFRLNEDKAIVNRYGFNSEGHDVVYERLRECREQQPPDQRVALGINLGKNKLSLDAIADYVQGVKRFGTLADYLVINVSSPNTPGLRTMQSKSTLQTLLTEVLKARASLPANEQRPILLKLAPDLSEEDLREIVDVVRAKACAVDGLIVSNTTIDRPATLRSVNAGQLGGLSGPPLKHRSTAMIARVYKLTEGKIPIIGVGGIFTGEDAFEKIEAGASAVQLYTSFIFHGPPVVPKIKRELDRLLEANGYASVQDAVGKGVDKYLA